MLKKTILKNGLMIITKQIKESKICNLGYIIRSGSYNEKDDEHGLAHLVEHMLFKGTNKRDYKEINNSMESIGGYLNAETNFDYTKYYCCVPFNQWKNGLEILNDIMFNHTIPQKELDKERKVVIEELKMYKDDPNDFVISELIKILFKDYPNRKSVGGEPEDINKLTRDKIIDFIKRNYNLKNMVFLAVGNIEHEDVVSYLKETVVSTNKNEKELYEKINLDSILKTTNYEIIDYNKNEIEQTYLSFGMFMPAYNDKYRYAAELINIMLGGNCSSILYDIIREQKGLSYNISTSYDSLEDVGVLYGFAGLNKENDSNLIVKEILNQLLSLEFNINEKMLESAKCYRIGNLYRGLDSITSKHDFYSTQILYNNFESVELIENNIKSVTLEDIKFVIRKYFTKDNIKIVRLQK